MTRVEYANAAKAGIDGVAYVRIGPATAVAQWKVTGMTSQVVNSTLTPQLRVYKNWENPSSLVNSALRAGSTVSTQDDIYLSPGETLLFVWSNCDPGVWCTATVTGEQA